METQPSERAHWWVALNKTQKFVFIVASMAWMLDCLDQQLFNLARSPALAALLTAEQAAKASYYAGLATTIFVLGWATGGMIFGSLGDKYGRARILAITVFIYSGATGLSALSTGFVDFALYRFITGVGVGGVFGLAVALIADTLPDASRPRALGAFQALSAVGNITAGLLGIGIALAALGGGYWKWLFIIGALPAVLTALIQTRLKEPQKWVEARAKAGKKAGSYRELFSHPKWRKHALLGVLLCCAGVVGLWGIGVFSNDMVGSIVANSLKQAGVPAGEIAQKKQFWMSVNLLVFNIGAYFGLLAFARVAVAWSRKKAFAIFFAGALVVTIFVFQSLKTTTDILWMAPLLGFFQLSVFGGYSIYLPELFPTRLRSTGTSFCYNVGRYLAATGPFTIGVLAANLAHKVDPQGLNPEAKIDAFRDAASWMTVVFLIGIAVLPFLPETKGKPLPEDD